MSSLLCIADDSGRWAVVTAEASGYPQRRLRVTGISLLIILKELGSGQQVSQYLFDLYALVCVDHDPRLHFQHNQHAQHAQTLLLFIP